MNFFLAIIWLFFCLQVFGQERGDTDSIDYYISKGQYSRALPFAKRSFGEVKNNSNKHSNYIAKACQIADIYVEMRISDSALLYYDKAKEEAKRMYGDTSALYGSLLGRTASMNSKIGPGEEAEQLFEEATSIWAKIDSSANKKLYTRYLTDYAGFYILTGNLKNAEQLCIRARNLALSEPVDIMGYASALKWLVTLYGKIGFNAEVDTMLVQLYEIKKAVYGEQHSEYAAAIGNLADVYQRQQNFEKADSMFKKALDIRIRLTGKNAAANIPILNRLGVVNMARGKYKEAAEYLEAAAEIIEENGGEEFSLYPYCIKNLARLYALTGRKEQAESLFQKCLAIYNKRGMHLHSDRQKVLYEMAELLHSGDTGKAALYLREAIVTENKLLLEKLDFLSETELIAYLKSNKDIADSPYRFLLRHKSPAIAIAAYNSKLLTSGIGLQNTRVLYQNMAQSKDSVLTSLWRNYLQLKSFYTTLLLTPATQRNINKDSVAEVLNRQEKDILRQSAEYRNMKENLAITWQDLRKHLLPGETAIEFVRFNGRYNTTRAEADTFYYAALLLRPQDTVPQFIVLCEEKQLTNAMKKFPYKAASKSRGIKAGDTQGATNALYKLIWQPLESYLAHTSTVYFSPDGMLHRVAFAAIPYKKSVLLCDRYNLVQLTSTRQLALKEIRPPAPISVAMFGGINYNFQSANTGVPAYPNSYAYAHSENRGAGLDSFRFLPHTVKEINSIKANTDTSQKKSIAFTAENATEAAFRSLGGNHSPQVIHFATHGFALPDTSMQKRNAGASFNASDHPLLRCGLVMAGGNKGWRGEARLNEDDGILTGLEISFVQLPHTELAVLSACETGLGKIEGSEGVFGLQRAFKLAGVNYVMASLWQVPDKETAEFMEIFYSCWLGGRTIRASFFNAQQTMRKKYAPYYWAGFTLVQ